LPRCCTFPFDKAAAPIPVQSIESASRRPLPAVPNTILFNGDIYLDDGARAQALAVSGDTISFVGSNEDAVSLRTEGVDLIDLRGHTVYPGIIDSHIHPFYGEFFLRRLEQVGGYTVEENLATLKRAALAAPPGDWVVAYGWYFTDNPRLDNIRLADLDAIVPDRKLVVFARDAHTLWVNTNVLIAFGIRRDTPDPQGGTIGRDPVTGDLTGVLTDAAASSVMNSVATDSSYASSTADILRGVVPHLNGLGLTSILDANINDDREAAYHALDAEGKLTLRVSLAFVVTPENYRSEIPRIAAKRASQSTHTRIDYIKLYADGNIEDGLANMLNPDGSPGTASKGYFTQAQMDEIVTLAEAHKLSIYVHSIGDGTVRQVLDAVEKARARGPCAGCRHTLTHLQWVAQTDLPRFKELGVIANIQEFWLSPRSFGGPPGYDYLQATADSSGSKIAGRMYPFRLLHRAGARISCGSDWFFTDESPWNTMEVGATSCDIGVVDPKPMSPGHTLDVQTLFEGRTNQAAFQLFSECTTGAIAIGKKADLVVVNQDIFQVPVNQIHKTRVLMTFLGGRKVYESDTR
jgi:predicted amidohydrolase YtcJ